MRANLAVRYIAIGVCDFYAVDAAATVQCNVFRDRRATRTAAAAA